MILFLKPFFVEKPWAGDELTKMFDCPKDTGEAWVVSGFKNKSTIILNGQYKGKSLRWLWSNKPQLFGNMIDKEFPLLIKLISSSKKLSVQVHPNDDYAIKRHNQLGKSECWYVLPGNKANTAAIGVNLKNAVEVRNVVNNNLLENYLIQRDIQSNDLIVVDPGTVHAMNEGTFVLEIQEASDITYRLYDYNREPKRELHLCDACNVIDYDNNKERIIDFNKTKSFANKFFEIYRHKISSVKKFDIDRFSIFYVLDGEASYDKYHFKKGDVFVVTSDTKNISITGQVELIEILPIPNTKDRFDKTIRKAIITGVESQDGYYLSKLLLDKKYEVYGLIQNQEAFKKSKTSEFVSNKDFKAIQCDLVNKNDLEDLIFDIKPDEIYHLAGQTQISYSFDNPVQTTLENSVATLRLLEAIKKGEVRTKLFNLETPYLFKGDIYPQSENTSFQPGSPYSISKLYSYQIAKNYRENFGIFVVNGICYNHESNEKIIGSVATKICCAANKIKRGELEYLELGNLNVVREFGHAEDYARAMWQSLQSDTADDYVIATGEGVTIRDFVTKVFKKVGIELVWHGEGLDEVGIDAKTKKVLVLVNPVILRPNDADILVGDATHFKNSTGFRFNHSLSSLIDELLEDDRRC